MTDPTAEILLRRARLLAAAPADDERPATLELLTFTTGGRLLALETRRVQRILRQDAVIRLPLLGGHLLGLVGSLGEAVPVADLGALLDGRAPQLGGQFVVVLDGDRPPVGLLVDDVFAVAEVPLDALHPTATDEHPVERGVTPDGVVVLDADRLLADPRLDHGRTRSPHSPDDLPPTPGAPCLP